MSEQHDELTGMLPDIQRAARSVSFKWPQVIAEDDLVQEIFLRLAETPGSVGYLAGMEGAERRSSLHRIGHQIASGERDDFERFSGQYSYSVDEVRNLLERGVLSRPMTDRFDAASLDLVMAAGTMEDGKPEYADALKRRYVRDERPERGSAAEKSLQRAVDTLTVHMNRGRASREYEFNNGGRYRSSVKSISSQYDTESTYEGWEAFDA